MQKYYQKAWQYCKQHRTTGILAGHVVVLTVLAIALLTTGFIGSISSAFAASYCGSNDQTYIVKSGDTLTQIASQYGTSFSKLADYNKLTNPNVIYVNQHICVPKNGSTTTTSDNGSTTTVQTSTTGYTAPLSKGTGNYFAYPQCTWWATERYHQLHGIYVPWYTNANAYQWVDRANQFGWRVSYTPVKGAIMVMQPWVQGAGGLGHVAIVENINADGTVTASNMNWGANPYSVAYTTITPGAGIAFVY
ncbi:COG3942 and LysM peptidoglycan-binding domain-containing protein [Ktedonobacter racemifer]|uniref:Peptidoglycan-binding lysin domain protein n=1 Tax=Ktedonobacter racemifer DSM 44963 TaxID=485913 RepID=D6THW7_KTERA|nr:LysM peptidoglycan-binding domain-containing protein [Ktedonobacter racemifer]EFH90937.1 Peptidoglycan-binding lysin domain protein [Ktedonobacter racemifer DSM 44963]